MGRKPGPSRGERHAPATCATSAPPGVDAGGTRTGLTLDEMAQALNVKRRTADRLRAAIANLFPQAEYWGDEGLVRRWRLPGGVLTGVAEPSAEGVAAVEVLARECAARGEADRAGLLGDAAATLRALMRPAALRRVEPDVEALMLAEGTALRPGPRSALDPTMLPLLRRAILSLRLVALRYARTRQDTAVVRTVCPYGVLYGGNGRVWLVAHVEELPEMRLWRLDRIVSLDMLDRYYVRQEGFDLAAYAAQSFGVFQGEPMDVVLRIVPEAAADAATWQFHPSQTVTVEADGSLLVQFRAGGTTELCWHLFTWGTAVTVVPPDTLREALAEMADSVARHNRASPNRRGSQHDTSQP